MERIFGIFGKAWVLCNIRSFDSWGGCRTPNFSSSISCLHVYMAWLRGLVLSVHGRVDVSAVRRGCKISWCATSPSGHATIVIKFTYALLWRSGHTSCSRVFHTRTHIKHYLQKDRNELSLEPRHIGVPEGASKMNSEPMWCVYVYGTHDCNLNGLIFIVEHK